MVGWGMKELVKQWMKDLVDLDANVRRNASRNLKDALIREETRDPVVEALVAGLKDEKYVCRTVIWIKEKICGDWITLKDIPPEAVQLLIEANKRWKDNDIIGANVLKILERHESQFAFHPKRKAIPYLIELLCSENVIVSLRAEEAIITAAKEGTLIDDDLEGIGRKFKEIVKQEKNPVERLELKIKLIDKYKKILSAMSREVQTNKLKTRKLGKRDGKFRIKRAVR